MRINIYALALGFAAIQASTVLLAGELRDRPFDDNWRFLQADTPDAENPAFDDFP